ncbi:MAG: class I SAM-dependent methyltransferase [Candidatus Omnitrophota bacterium]
MRQQTQQEKQSEQEFRRKAFHQRFECGSEYRSQGMVYGDNYIELWVKPELRQLKDLLTESIREKLSGNVLELGAESGHISAYIRNNFCSRMVVASDISEILIKAMHKVSENFNFTLLPRAVVADNYHLPFKDASIDIVLGFSILHHVPDPQSIMEEVRRVIKKDGMALFAGEPFLPPYLLPLQVFYSVPAKRLGICERVFSLKQWFSFMPGFKVEFVRLSAPKAVKSLFPQAPFIYRYFTGGGLAVGLRKS